MSKQKVPCKNWLFKPFIFLVFSTLLMVSPMKAQSKVYSEVPIKFENGIKKSTAIIVKFKLPVLNLGKGVKQSNIIGISSQYPEISQYLRSLEEKYGKITLIKRVPDAVWGDIWRSNVVTGERVKVHDKSQIFTISFENDVPIDEIISELKQM